MSRTSEISEYIAEAGGRPLAAEVESLVRLHLLDTLAAIVACRDLEPARVARTFIDAKSGGDSGGGAGGRQVSVLGTERHAPLVDAVFAGAMTAHAAEINDFMPEVFVQPGPAIVAAALGLGEQRSSTPEELLRAIATGYDLAFRVPLAVGVGNLRRAGVATHGVGPCFGAAAASSVLLGLPAERIGDVLSLVAQQASGSWQWLLDVEHMEKALVFAGLGARNGVESALMVASGFRGVPDVLDRPGTWFTAGLAAGRESDADLDALRVTDDPDGLGSARALRAAAFKRYPVGGPTQPAVEALLDLCQGLAADDVDRIVVEMPGRADAFRDAGMPALNLRYLASIIVLDGRLDFVAAQSLDRMRDDAEVARLMARIEVHHDPSQEPPQGAKRTESARVTVRRRSGPETSQFVPHVTGFPSHPMTALDVESKALELVGPVLGPERARALIHACQEPFAADAAQLAALIAPAASGATASSG